MGLMTFERAVTGFLMPCPKFLQIHLFVCLIGTCKSAERSEGLALDFISPGLVLPELGALPEPLDGTVL